MLHLIIIFLCAITRASSYINFYKERGPAVSGTGYGQTCFNFTEYIPKCGWKTIIKSPSPISSIEIYDQYADIIDEYTIITRNREHNPQMSPRDWCSTFNFHGPFGNSAPQLFITWYCICDDTTSGLCKIVYFEETTTQETTTQAVTTESISDATDITSAATAPWSLHLTRSQDICYIGQNYTTLRQVRHFVHCCSVCITKVNCKGLNYRRSLSECDLVNADRDVNSDLFQIVVGCSFWKVLWKK